MATYEILDRTGLRARLARWATEFPRAEGRLMIASVEPAEHLAAMIERIARANDIVARLNDNEVVVVAFDVSEDGEAAVQQRLTEAARELQNTTGSPVSFRLGSTHLRAYEPVTEALRRADHALVKLSLTAR